MLNYLYHQWEQTHLYLSPTMGGLQLDSHFSPSMFSFVFKTTWL